MKGLLLSQAALKLPWPTWGSQLSLQQPRNSAQEKFPLCLGYVFHEGCCTMMLILSSAGRWAVGNRVPYQVSVKWAHEAFIGDYQNIFVDNAEEQNSEGFSWSFLACNSALFLPGVMEGKSTLSSNWKSTKVFQQGMLGEHRNKAEFLPTPQKSCRAEAYNKCRLFCIWSEREIMQHPPWEEFECPWLCGASILPMKSEEAKSLGSHVVLKSESSLSCKIFQRFCLKVTDLQEGTWSACLIRGKM